MAVNPKDEKGIALILTISLIAIIVVMTLQFSTSIRTGLYETANFDDSIRLRAIAKSGFDCALAVLYEDDTDADSFQDDWASLNEYSAFSAVLFDNEGMFDIQVTDLAGKIQINRLVNLDGENKGQFNSNQKEILTRLLKEEIFDLEDDMVEDIVNAIKDWIDEDDVVTDFGAEDYYYQSLDQPYSCRNAPFESLEELLLVRDITPEIFYGTDEIPGISDYLTVQGEGPVNINTADPVVLEAISEELDSTMIEEIIEYRDNEKNDLDSPDWYKTALGTSEDYIDPGLITIKSSYFEIRSTGVKDTRTKGIKGIVNRKGKSLTVLSWKML